MIISYLCIKRNQSNHYCKDYVASQNHMATYFALSINHNVNYIFCFPEKLSTFAYFNNFKIHFNFFFRKFMRSIASLSEICGIILEVVFGHRKEWMEKFSWLFWNVIIQFIFNFPQNYKSSNENIIERFASEVIWWINIVDTIIFDRFSGGVVIVLKIFRIFFEIFNALVRRN